MLSLLRLSLQRIPSRVGTVQELDIALRSVRHPNAYNVLDVIQRLGSALAAQKTKLRVLG